MVKVRYIFIMGAIGLIALLSWNYLFPREEKKVIKRFELLSRYVEKKPEEDLLSTAQRVKDLSQLFANPCEFKIEGDPFYSFTGTYSREEIRSYALRGRSYFRDLSIRFYDYQVQFLDKKTAQVRLTARLIGISNGGERIEEVRELLCFLKKIKDIWFFSGLEVLEVLK